MSYFSASREGKKDILSNIRNIERVVYVVSDLDIQQLQQQLRSKLTCCRAHEDKKKG
jgi:hypothetical protein